MNRPFVFVIAILSILFFGEFSFGASSEVDKSQDENSDKIDAQKEKTPKKKRIAKRSLRKIVNKEISSKEQNKMFSNIIRSSLKKKNGKTASLCKDLSKKYPHSKYAAMCILAKAYAEYSSGKYEKAIFSYNEFIDLHSGRDEISYAYYMRGLNYLKLTSYANRDLKYAKKAAENFEYVIKMFPDTEYAFESQNRLEYIKELQGCNSLMIAIYYYKTGDYIATINRCSKIIKKLTNFKFVDKTKKLLAASLREIGLKEEAFSL